MKTKRFLSVLLTSVMVIGLLSSITLTVSAEETSGSCGSDGDNATWQYDTETNTIIFSGTGDMAAYSFDNLLPWHTYKEEIETAIFSDGVTSICKLAFYQFANLKNVSLPDGITVINANAFADCSSLEEIKIPSGVATTGGQVFKNCVSLKEVILPSGVTELSSWVFKGCSSLTGITIPDTVKTIDGYCFINTSVKEITIPSSVETVASALFQNVPDLTEVTIPASVTELENATFFQSPNLKRVYYLGKNEVEYTDTTMREAADFTVYVSNDYEGTTFAGKQVVKTTLHAITFDMGGYGIKPTDRYAADGEVMEEPFTHSDENAIFDGWYKEAECNNVWDFNVDVVTADTTLYAKWIQSPVVAVVTLDATYGSCDVKTIATSNGKLSEALPTPVPNDTIYEGYWFKGWYDAPTGGNEITADTEFIINTTIYAQWDVVKPEIIEYYTIKVDFTFPKAGENVFVIFADYKEWDDPTFADIKYVTVTTTKTQGEEVMSVTVPDGIEPWAGDKIMIWQNFNTCMPLCEAYAVSGRETPVEDTNPGIDLLIDRN